MSVCDRSSSKYNEQLFGHCQYGEHKPAKTRPSPSFSDRPTANEVKLEGRKTRSLISVTEKLRQTERKGAHFS